MNTKRWMWTGLISLIVPAVVLACGGTYVVYTAITQPQIIQPGAGQSVPVDTDVTVSCTTSTDQDQLVPPGTVLNDTVNKYAWWVGEGEPFLTSQSGTWHTPAAAGTYELHVSADDAPLYYDDSAASSSREVDVVGVSKVQYKEKQENPEDPVVYTDITGTLYVMKGTEVQFKAIKSPGDASWPTGKPVWGGTAGASGSGETTTVTFNAVSSSTTDYKTVTAECGNTVTVNVVVYELEIVLDPLDDFPGRSMTRFGIREIITLDYVVDPPGTYQIGSLEWSRSPDVGTLFAVSGIYFAPGIAANVTLRLEIKSGLSTGQHTDKDIQIIEPEGIRFIQIPGTGIWHEGNTSTIGMLCWIYLEPKDVSFANLSYREDTAPSSTTGYFTAAFPNGYPHPISNPVLEVSNGDLQEGCWVDAVDHVECICDPPWSDGTFGWDIPQQYYNGSQWVTITNLEHRAEIDGNGKLKIKKEDVGWHEKNVDDGDSVYWP